METVTLIISLIALICGIVAVIRSGKVKEVKTEQTIIHAPIEHPFIYDEKDECYWLKGSLHVDGEVSCSGRIGYNIIKK